MDIPKTQYAVQLVGPDELELNTSKEVFVPGAHQVLGQVEAVGLCFSDLKLLKQFSDHPRKGPVVSGIDQSVLEQVPSYVPGSAPTVPGHEVVVRIAAVGPEVEGVQVGDRYLVQTDYRWLRTASNNGAFGYNFEGALQEYVLMDLRVITSPDGESMLLPAGEKLCGSAVALVEPWACVEDAYASRERTTLKAGGRMAVVADGEMPEGALAKLFAQYGEPGEVACVGCTVGEGGGATARQVEAVAQLDDEGYDDVVYFGSRPETVEALFAKVGKAGLLNIVQCGGRFGRDIVATVGRVHYGGIRIVGTPGSDPCESMQIIPKDDELRSGDKVNVIGAGGPMGMMHTIRNICQGVEGVSVWAGDLDDNRLAMLSKVAKPAAQQCGVPFETYNPKTDGTSEQFDYAALMVPVPALAAQAVKDAARRGLINIFAGIPASVTGEIDLDMYIEKELYFIGTSGSTLDDMKQMLAKAQSGRLDTNVSVAAISGMQGATEGIRAVENRLIAGKIIVYPACRELGLIRLEELEKKLPEVGAALCEGLWTAEAERVLLDRYGS